MVLYALCSTDCFFSCKQDLVNKVWSSVAVCRRGGASTTFHRDFEFLSVSTTPQQIEECSVKDLRVLQTDVFLSLTIKFPAKAICRTINLCNFKLREHRTNHFNIKIEYYSLSTIFVILLIIKKILVIISNSHKRIQQETFKAL